MQIRLRSGEVRKVHVDCRATIGEVGNGEHSPACHRQGWYQSLAWYSPDGARHPMNPVDHPMVVVPTAVADVITRIAVGSEGQKGLKTHQQAH